MRYFTYSVPIDEAGTPQDITLSEEDILRDYYPAYRQLMVEKHGRAVVNLTYTFEDCLNDWIAIHWAWESADIPDD